MTGRQWQQQRATHRCRGAGGRQAARAPLVEQGGQLGIALALLSQQIEPAGGEVAPGGGTLLGGEKEG